MKIWKSYMWTAEWRIKWRHEPIWAPDEGWSSHFCSCEKKAWEKFRVLRDSNPWPLRYRCRALSQLGAGRCDLSTDMKFYLFMIKKELRCTEAQFSVVTLHQSNVLTIYSARSRFRLLTVLYILVKAQEAQFLTACLFAECFQSVSIGHETGVSRHPEALYGMVANLQNNFEAKHFNLKSLVADLFVSLVW